MQIKLNESFPYPPKTVQDLAGLCIKKYYKTKGEDVDYNAITNSKIAGSSGVLKRAKNLALRSTVFEKLVK